MNEYIYGNPCADLLCYLKDVHSSPIFLTHRAQNLGEASPLVVLSRQGLHRSMEDKHLLVLFRGDLFFVPNNVM